MTANERIRLVNAEERLVLKIRETFRELRLEPSSEGEGPGLPCWEHNRIGCLECHMTPYSAAEGKTPSPPVMAPIDWIYWLNRIAPLEEAVARLEPREPTPSSEGEAASSPPLESYAHPYQPRNLPIQVDSKLWFLELCRRQAEDRLTRLEAWRRAQETSRQKSSHLLDCPNCGTPIHVGPLTSGPPSEPWPNVKAGPDSTQQPTT